MYRLAIDLGSELRIQGQQRPSSLPIASERPRGSALRQVGPCLDAVEQVCGYTQPAQACTRALYIGIELRNAGHSESVADCSLQR